MVYEVFLQKLEKWCLKKTVYVLDSTSYSIVWAFSSSEPNKADIFNIPPLSVCLLVPKCEKRLVRVQAEKCFLVSYCWMDFEPLFQDG